MQIISDEFNIQIYVLFLCWYAWNFYFSIMLFSIIHYLHNTRITTAMCFTIIMLCGWNPSENLIEILWKTKVILQLLGISPIQTRRSTRSPKNPCWCEYILGFIGVAIKRASGSESEGKRRSAWDSHNTLKHLFMQVNNHCHRKPEVKE